VEIDEEREFVRRARAGDRAAFAALVDRYWNPLRAWLAGLAGGDDHAAEDVAQEAFFKAWIGLPRLAADETFRVWLFRIARNEFVTRARTQRLPRSAGRTPHLVEDTRPGPDTVAEEQEIGAALREAIARLSVPYREAYLLWTGGRLPYSEIARIIDATEDVARWRVCEARRQLVRALERFLNPPKQ
jgi:RNA polymerase sigma-70 factor (ECF subfamily)